MEDDDGLIQQQPMNNKSGFMTIVKIKKKACVCLKDLNDYDNFVWKKKHPENWNSLWLYEKHFPNF